MGLVDIRVKPAPQEATTGATSSTFLDTVISLREPRGTRRWFAGGAARTAAAVATAAAISASPLGRAVDALAQEQPTLPPLTVPAVADSADVPESVNQVGTQDRIVNPLFERVLPEKLYGKEYRRIPTKNSIIHIMGDQVNIDIDPEQYGNLYDPFFAQVSPNIPVELFFYPKSGPMTTDFVDSSGQSMYPKLNNRIRSFGEQLLLYSQFRGVILQDTKALTGFDPDIEAPQIFIGIGIQPGKTITPAELRTTSRILSINLIQTVAKNLFNLEENGPEVAPTTWPIDIHNLTPVTVTAIV